MATRWRRSEFCCSSSCNLADVNNEEKDGVCVHNLKHGYRFGWYTYVEPVYKYYHSVRRDKAKVSANLTLLQRSVMAPAFSAAASEGGVMMPERPIEMEMQVDPVALFIASSSNARKRALDAMQSDGRKEPVEDTPDRTSSEDEHHRDTHAGQRDPGLPPMVPVKVAAKDAMKQPPKVPEHETATAHASVGGAQVVQEKEFQEAEEVETSKHVAKACKLPPPPGLKGKLKAKGATGKKAAAKPDRRRKRKVKAASESTGMSQSSAQMLFRCTCQLLRSQTLDYDVRAREMEDRNAAQAKEIEQWEKRVRSLKRELQEYADESGEQPMESAGMALVVADPSANAAAAARGMDERNRLSSAMASTPAAAFGESAAMDTSLPPTVAAAEAKLQEELRKRTQKVNEFCRSVPGFIESLDEQRPRPL